MTISDLFDCLRVLIAFAVLFSGVPWLILRIKSEDRTTERFWGAAVQSALFASTVSAALGMMQLCLPGAMLAAYIGLFGLVGSQHGVWQRVLCPSRRVAFVHHAIIVSNSGVRPRAFALPALDCRIWVRRVARHPALLFGFLVMFAGLLACVHYIRFLHDETYSRSLSLQQLSLGQPWTPQSGVALLAPVAFLSSSDGATVVRFSGPIFLGVLALAAYGAICAKAANPALAMVATAVIVVFVAVYDSGEVRPGSIALIAWTSAFVFWLARPWDAVCSVALAILVEPIPGIATVTGVLLLICVSSLARVPYAIPLVNGVASPALAIGSVCVLAVFLSWREGDGPQYNAVARAVTQMTRDLPRNTFLVVSPVQEVALMYGHGWHMELSEFVDKFSPGQVSNAAFVFPFPVVQTIVIVEKTPLRSRSVWPKLASLGSHLDPLVAPYLLRSRRDAMQFRAAMIMTAYRTTHRGVELVAEDENITIYRIKNA